MTKRAGIYARVSSDDRGNEGRNLEGQRTLCLEHARKQGWDVIYEFCEDEKGVSGANLDAPELNRALDIARAGGFDVLVVRELDRFARKLAKQLIIESEFKRAGVAIEYVLGEYADNPEGALMKNVRAVIAEYEREKIRERVVRGRRLKVASGQVIIPKGQAPFGYQVMLVDLRRVLVINEDEAWAVRLIFDWYTVGDETGIPLTVHRIATKLTKLNIPSYGDTRSKNNKQKERGFGEWGQSMVSNILKNETYAGVWHYGKRPISDKGRDKVDHEDCLKVPVPAIISRETWELAHARLAYNKANSPRNVKHKYLLRRRARCGRCGLKMACRGYVNNRNKAGGYVMYYCCPSNTKGLTVRECGARYFRGDVVDEAVWASIKQMLTDPLILDEGINAYRDELETKNTPMKLRLAVVEELLKDNRQQLDRLLPLYLTGEFPKEVLIDHKKKLESTIQSLEREQTGLENDLKRRQFTDEQVNHIRAIAAAMLEGVRTGADEQDFEARRSIIDALDVQVALIWKDNQGYAHITCKLGEGDCELSPTQFRFLFCLRPR